MQKKKAKNGSIAPVTRTGNSKKGPILKLIGGKKTTRGKGKKPSKKQKKIRALFVGGGHWKRNCPELKKRETPHKTIHNISRETNLEEGFEPYLSKGKVNGIEITILRDSGSNVDVVPGKWVNSSQFNGNVSWVKQPLVSDLRCLPIAEVTLELPNKRLITTNAIVTNEESDINYYILGNLTQKLIDSGNALKPQNLHAVTTRGQAKQLAKDNETKSSQNLEPHDPGVHQSREINTEKATEHGESDGSEGEESTDLPPLIQDETFLLSKIERKDFETAQREDNSLELIRQKAREKKSFFEYKNSIVIRKVKDHRGSEREQIVVPTKFRKAILSACHESSAAHLGEKKTKDKILRYFFWPNVIKEAQSFVKSCTPCQLVGKSGETKKAPLARVPIVPDVFSKLSIDLVGPLPKSKKGNKYMLTALCVFSKYPEAIAIENMSSETVVQALMQIFSRLGYATEVQTDLGKSFTSNLTTAFFEKFGVRLRHSSVCNPKANNVERLHRTIKRLLKVMCLESGTDWEENLPHALLAIRNAISDSTGFSPAELVFGKNLRTPETLLFEQWTGENKEPEIVTEYVFELMNRLKRCQDLAEQNLLENREKRKTRYDKQTIVRDFQPGDQVLVLATQKPHKMAASWTGPGIIKEKISDTNYVIEVPGRRAKEQIFHVNLLKPYIQRVEKINILAHLCDGEEYQHDLEIAFPLDEPDNFNFEEIVKESNLMDRCNNEQLRELEILLGEFREVFSNNPGATDMEEHDIEVVSDKPVRVRPYRMSRRQEEILEKEIKRMLELNIIKEGESDYYSPLILVESAGKDPRPCVDFRRLNSITKIEYYPLPNIEERVENVAAAKFITVLDLTKGYWQIPMTPRAQKYAAFVTNKATYLPLRLPFGLVNASYRFSKFMAKLLKGLEDFCLPYLDDMAIFSETWEDHLKHIREVLSRIRDAKLTVKISKCKFAQRTVKYLGHIVGEGQRRPAEAKIKAITDLAAPKSKTEIRRCLGMAGYYARYIQNYATIVEPLTRALKGKNKREKITWDDEMERAFQTLKEKLTAEPILYAPNYEAEFIIQTDASNFGIGAVLAQRINSEEHPIIYLSRKFSETEKKFSATERECAAIIFAIKKLRHYIDGQKFLIETDHCPLTFLKNNAGNNPRLLRWALTLQPYQYAIKHRPGKDIKHVDFLSRAE